MRLFRISLICIGLLAANSLVMTWAWADGIASPSPSITPAVTQEEGQKLIEEFQAEQKAELDQLLNDNQREMRNLDASQKSRYHDWIAKERIARHKYFSDHPELKRAEKRAYIEDYRNREKGFLVMEREERLQRQAEQDAHVESVKSDQAAHMKEFKLYIEHGERPPPWLR